MNVSKVLIVDNDLMFLALFGDILREEGFQVKTANNGKECLEEIKKNPPDILFTDLIMPKISGEQLIKYVRSDPALADIVIVIISGALTEYSGRDQLGADYYIEKSEIGTIREKLRDVCQNIVSSKGRETPSLLHKKGLRHRKIVEELLSSRSQKRQISQCMKEGLIVYDFDHKILEVNPAAEKYLGKSLNDLLNTSVEEHFDPSDREQIKAILKKLPKGKQKDNYLTTTLGPKTLDLIFSVFKDDQGESPPGGIILIYDLTRQKLIEQRLEKKIKEMGLLNQIAQILNSSLSEDAVFNSMLEKSVELLAAEAGTIAILESNNDHLRNLVFRYTYGETAENIRGVRVGENHGLIGWVVSQNEPVIVNEVKKDSRFLPDIDYQTGFDTRSILCTPIRSDKNVIGAIEILNIKEGQFDQDDLVLLNTIVDVASLTIKNSLLHRDIIIQRDYYSGILNSVNEGVIILDRNLSVLEVNQFFLIFFNRERADIIGQKCYSVFFGRNQPCPGCFVEQSRVFEQGEDFSANLNCRNFQEKLYHFKVSGTQLEVEDEIVTSVLLTFSDITRIENLHNYLKASASVASLLLKGGNIRGLVGDVIKIMGQTAEASRCYWFENHKDAYGRIYASLRSEWCSEEIEPQIDNPGLQTLSYENACPGWHQEMSTGKIISVTLDDSPDEERAFLESRNIKSILLLPLFIKESFEGFIGFDNCVNGNLWQDAEINLLRSAVNSLANAFEHERYDKKIEENEARYRDIFENVSDFWYLHDMEGKIIEVNPAIERTTGYQETELLSMTVRDIIPERYKNMFDDYLRVLKEKGVAEGLIRIVIKSGEERILEYKNWLVELPNGIIACRGLVKDMTDRMRLKSQLRHAQKMESIGVIASGISHNFRNILAGVMANTQLIQLKYQSTPELQSYADEIVRLTKTGSDLITDLLQFSRKVRIGQKTFINLVEVLKETFHIINRSFDKKTDIQTDLAELLPIYGDHSALSQVFMNLCTNARDAMPDGGTLRIDAKKEKNRVTVAITDTGCGMDEETVKKIFDPFFTTKEPGRGTGLGLSTAYGIVKNHGGEIQVQSRVGKGTSFKIFFPLPDAVPRDKKIAVPEIIKGNGEKVLIVDDEQNLLRSMEELLDNLGYKSDSVTSGQKALEKYEAWRPDVVLLDRNMPEMDGLTALKKILSMDPDAKIILISGYEMAGPDGIDDWIRKRIKGYLTKPVDIIDLSKVMAGVILK